jgi:hypothetical protein
MVRKGACPAAGGSKRTTKRVQQSALIRVASCNFVDRVLRIRSHTLHEITLSYTKGFLSCPATMRLRGSMTKSSRQLTPLIILLLVTWVTAFAQTQELVPSCSQKTFAVFKQLPKLEYECPEGANDSDDKILKMSATLAAIRGMVKQLEGFTDAAWWQSNVEDLSACGVHGSAGELTEDEKERWKQGDYSFELFGNHQMRLALIDDPCYQTGYNGSNAFLLYRKDGRVFVSQVLNGYYSRIDNSVGIDFANLNGGHVVFEVTTANSMTPSLRSYFFVIDPKTNRALPKKIFKEGSKLTNEIYSAMLMNEPADVGLPKDAEALKVFRDNRLAVSFSAYEQDEQGKIDDNGRKLRRIVYRWNGRFFERRGSR